MSNVFPVPLHKEVHELNAPERASQHHHQCVAMSALHCTELPHETLSWQPGSSFKSRNICRMKASIYD